MATNFHSTTLQAQEYERLRQIQGLPRKESLPTYVTVSHSRRKSERMLSPGTRTDSRESGWAAGKDSGGGANGGAGDERKTISRSPRKSAREPRLEEQGPHGREEVAGDRSEQGSRGRAGRAAALAAVPSSVALAIEGEILKQIARRSW
jgi:hypothetical protein